MLFESHTVHSSLKFVSRHGFYRVRARWQQPCTGRRSSKGSPIPAEYFSLVRNSRRYIVLHVGFISELFHYCSGGGFFLVGTQISIVYNFILCHG